MNSLHLPKLVTATLLVTPIASAFLAAAAVHAAEPGPTVTIKVIDPYATEAGHAALFLATRDGSITQPLTVPIKLSGSATPGVDYVNPGAITFPAQTAMVLVEITPLADTLAEGTETLTVSLAPMPNAYTLGNENSATATISDTAGPASSNASQAGQTGSVAQPRRVNPGSQGLRR